MIVINCLGCGLFSNFVGLFFWKIKGYGGMIDCMLRLLVSFFLYVLFILVVNNCVRNKWLSNFELCIEIFREGLFFVVLM